MFGIILITVITILHIYVFGRIASLTWIRTYLPLKYQLGAAILLWGLFFLSRTLRHNHLGILSGVVEFAGLGWMGALFLLFTSFLVVDLVTLFGLLFHSLAPQLRTGALIAGIAMSIIAMVQGMRPPVIKEYTVRLAGLPPQMAGKKIVALTDMHLGVLLGRQWLANRFKQVNALAPDLVVLVGDILDGHDGTLETLKPVFRRLKPPLGTFAVLGNHEFYKGADKCTNFLEQSGVTVLRNRWVEINPGLTLAGVDDLTAVRHLRQKNDFLTKALTARPEGATILLSHTPWHTEAAAESGVGLMISGHTHNGQIWPFGYLVRRYYPLLYGLYDVSGMKVIVCRGTGTWGPRMRLWYPGEILCITLQTET